MSQSKMKITISLVYAVIVLSGIVLIPNAFAENVPDWVKNTAGWWAADVISETEFVNAIEYLVKEDVIRVNVSQTSETSQGVPDWVKNTAGWWAENVISETEFVNAISYLIKVGIINIESSKSPELIAQMWVDGQMDDDEFLRNVDYLVESGIITAQTDFMASMSDLPDWLVNNAGWWTAKIITNSDFVFDPEYVKERIYPCKDDSGVYSVDLVGERCAYQSFAYNSHGFRGDEFEKEKPDDTFRIFTVGGSTTFGIGAEDDETWPAHLQQIINDEITDREIEVINTGTPGFSSSYEYTLINDKLSMFDPDLIIVYDGFNDYLYTPVDETIHNWKLVCELGKDKGFDTIIIVHPMAITGHRISTDQEMENGMPFFTYLQTSQQYVDGFKELNNLCSKTFDFRGIFDYIQEPIFWDKDHVMSFGNKIVAKNVFSVISSTYFGKTYSVWDNNWNSGSDESGTGVVYAIGANFSGKNFDNLNLKNAIFGWADLSNTSFKNTDISGARFVFANLTGVDLSGKDLTGTTLTGADLSNTKLKIGSESGKEIG